MLDTPVASTRTVTRFELAGPFSRATLDAGGLGWSGTKSAATVVPPPPVTSSPPPLPPPHPIRAAAEIRTRRAVRPCRMIPPRLPLVPVPIPAAHPLGAVPALPQVRGQVGEVLAVDPSVPREVMVGG